MTDIPLEAVAALMGKRIILRLSMDAKITEKMQSSESVSNAIEIIKKK